MILGFI